MNVHLEAKDDDEYKLTPYQINHHKEKSEELNSFVQCSKFDNEFFFHGCQESEITIIGSNSRTKNIDSNILEQTIGVKEHELASKGELEHKNLDQRNYINELEMKLTESNEKNIDLSKRVEEIKEEAEIKIALLKSELHKSRSKLAGAVASEQRSKIEKSAINIALHHLAVEFTESKTENNQLKEAIKQTTESMISREEYEVLMIKNSELANQVQEMMEQEDYKVESERLKKDLEIANGKIAGFRLRAEQAITRAQAAEKVKETLEERVKRWKEQRAKKKALHVESNSNLIEDDVGLRYKNAAKVHLPLGKILNMKY